MPQLGCFQKQAHHFPIRVYFEDVDFTGVVYHPNYLKYFERARTDALRLMGITPHDAFGTAHGYFTIVDLGIKYRRPARLDDELLITSQITELKAASWVVHQRVMRGEEEVAHADIRVAFLSTEGRPKRQPKQWTEAYKVMLKKLP